MKRVNEKNCEPALNSEGGFFWLQKNHPHKRMVQVKHKLDVKLEK